MASPPSGIEWIEHDGPDERARKRLGFLLGLSMAIFLSLVLPLILILGDGWPPPLVDIVFGGGMGLVLGGLFIRGWLKGRGTTVTNLGFTSDAVWLDWDGRKERVPWSSLRGFDPPRNARIDLTWTLRYGSPDRGSGDLARIRRPWALRLI